MKGGASRVVQADSVPRKNTRNEIGRCDHGPLRLPAALRPSAERCGPPEQPILAWLKPCPDTKRVRARWTCRQLKIAGDRELSRHNAAALRPSAERVRSFGTGL